ncbi:MAG: hypothetical protein KAV87_38530, partial [Desulfobacteraceae bacterium]|nr:hypothetical protein [Desulfobacteraceae bacterium]
SKAPYPPASGSRNVHNQATNFSVLKRDLHALVLHVFKDLNCYGNYKFNYAVSRSEAKNIETKYC